MLHQLAAGLRKPFSFSPRRREWFEVCTQVLYNCQYLKLVFFKRRRICAILTQNCAKGFRGFKAPPESRVHSQARYSQWVPWLLAFRLIFENKISDLLDA
jgi:hypothetical protein